MADIELKCQKCSKTVTVSEFADITALTCNACGGPLGNSLNTPKKERTKPTIKVAAAPAEESTTNTSDVEPTKWQVSQQAAIDKRPKRKFEMTHLLWSTIIFFILGGIMGYLRYSGGYLEKHKDLVCLYGPILLIAIHITIILCAFKDSVFQGTLCLLVPFYSLYYLFNVSDNFYLRAITAGLLIGIGQDSFGVFSKWSQDAYYHANNFISSGGGALQSIPRGK